eukprot:Gb_36957 [translate_table: standard]
MARSRSITFSDIPSIYTLHIILAQRAQANIPELFAPLNYLDSSYISVNLRCSNFQGESLARMEGWKFDEKLWVIQIKESMEEEEKELSISVFNVPKELQAAKPEAYIPQAVSIGPYHHWRSELYEMERYKLAAARRAQRRINGHKFDSVVEEFQKHVCQIRSCYHKFLDYSDETLAWLMALDASFVLEYLQFYVNKDLGKALENWGPALFDPNGRTAAHNAIVRDLTMLENQVPLFLLQKLLEMQSESKEKAEETLSCLVREACTELSPFEFALPKNLTDNLKHRGHILELLYYALVPICGEQDEKACEDKGPKPSIDTKPVREAVMPLWRAFSSLNSGPVRRLLALPQRVMRGRPMQLVTKLPWRLLSTLGGLPVLRTFKGPLTFLFKTSDGKEGDTKQEGRAGQRDKTAVTPPLRDELQIPCVADLYHAGVKFAPSDGDLTSIRFDWKTITLYLPEVRLDTNTEVILRNMVAFEASAAPGALVFTRYTDFMNGIIDTVEDVSLLRKSGIIYNHLQSDAEVASMWNSMGKCVRLTKVRFMDVVIADVNKYYNRRWNVAMAGYVKRYIFDSWQFLSLLAAIVLLSLTCLQSFCSVYDCKKWISETGFLQD